jgi:hypothetical protein
LPGIRQCGAGQRKTPSEHFKILVPVLIGDDAVDHFHSARGTNSTRGTLPAALDGAKLHGEAGLSRQIRRVVEHDDATVPTNPFNAAKVS